MIMHTHCSKGKKKENHTHASKILHPTPILTNTHTHIENNLNQNVNKTHDDTHAEQNIVQRE